MRSSEEPHTVFISSSRDMAEWAALAAAHARHFSQRYGLSGLETLDYRDIDPVDIDHAFTWQDNVGAPSKIGAALTVILIGERLGTPLPSSFQLRHDIHNRLIQAGYDWVHVAGITAAPPQPHQVPLTGVLFEFFDAFLPPLAGSQPGRLRIFFKGSTDGTGEPDFGNGDFRAQIEAAENSAQRRRQLRKEYDQQLDWMNIFWSKLYGLQQHASLFCEDQAAFVEQLDRALAAEFLASGESASKLARGRVDPVDIQLPGPAPYDLERAPFFLGRGSQVAELTRRALRHESKRRLVPVLGETGAGKSSLLRAGLLTNARSPVQRRLGWRSAFISLAERPSNQSPIRFLARALANPCVLPELGNEDALLQRLNGVPPIETARRLLSSLAEIKIGHTLGMGMPKLLIIVDQFEQALDGARRKESMEAQEWTVLFQLLSVLGDATIDHTASLEIESYAEQVVAKLPVSIVLGFPADRFNSFNLLLRPGDHIFHLPRLVDDTALREIISGTFSALGLKIEPEARETLCKETVRLARRTEASILPVLAVTLAGLHDDWKYRQSLEAKWKGHFGEQDTIPLGLEVLGVQPIGDRRFDIVLENVVQHGQLDKALARLGELAWTEAETAEPGIKLMIQQLPISTPQQKTNSGEMSVRDFALARLLRQLVIVSTDEAVPDRLVGLQDDEIDDVARPLAEALRRHRLMTRHDDGTWWLVHEAVLTGWSRAASWRESEAQSFRISDDMERDRRRWQEEVLAGEQEAGCWLWTRPSQVEKVIDWMTLLGSDYNRKLVAFAKASMVEAVRQNTADTGRILRVATYFDDETLAEAILVAAGDRTLMAVNRVNKDNTTSALTNACYIGNSSLVDLLLKHGANPNLVPSNGSSPLEIAASKGFSKVTNLLISAGALVDHASTERITALMAASQIGSDCIVDELLLSGADVSRATIDGFTALMNAAQYGHDAIAVRLLKSGADVTSSTNDGFTSLIFAASNGHESIVASLLDSGATADYRDGTGATALIHAAQNGYVAIVNRLLEAGAEVDRLTNDGETALFRASQNGHSAVVSALLVRGAVVNRVAENGTTPLFVAARNGHQGTTAILLDAGADADYAIDCPRDSRCDDHSTDPCSPKDFDSPRPPEDLDGWTALIASAENGHDSIVEQLLTAGAAIDKQNTFGTTALMAAVGSANVDSVSRLLAAGANCNAADKGGWTALIIAVNACDEHISRLLTEHRADPLKRNNDGQNALELAYVQGNKAIIEMFLAAGTASLSAYEIEMAKKLAKSRMNIGLVANARGKVCLVHDTPFPATPIWVGYHIDQNRLEIFFDTGASKLIDWEATDEIREYLLKIDRLLIIRMEARKPVEGYDTSFLRLEGRKLVT